MSDVQKRINNDAVSREESEKREKKRPIWGGEVMSSIFDMLIPMKRSEGCSWIYKSGVERGIWTGNIYSSVI